MAAGPVTVALQMDGAVVLFEVSARPAGGHAAVICRDVSAETSVREVLLESRQRYKQLVEIGADFIWECDETGAFSFVSEPGAFGFPPDRLIGRQPARFVVPSEDGIGWPSRVIAPVRGLVVSVLAADGRPVRLSLDAGPTLDQRHGRRGVRGVARVLKDAPPSGTAASRADAMAAVIHAMQMEWRPADALHSCAAGVWRGLAASGCVIYGEGDGRLKLAEAGELPPERSLQGCLDGLRDGNGLFRFADAEGQLLGIAVHCQNRPVGAIVVWRLPGATPWTQAEVDQLVKLDGPCGVAVRQALEIRRLIRLSRSDSLTGLLNRRAFLTELTAALARSCRTRATGALIYLDLNNFKQLNDLHGHETGNEALKGIAGILSSAIRPYDLAARLGGDEFALWLEDISGRDAGRSARRIADAIARWSACHAPQGTPLGASIGLAVFDPAQAESAEDLIERADRAMYRAKRAADGRVAVARARRRTAPRTA